jgi:hypothetical protein
MHRKALRVVPYKIVRKAFKKTAVLCQSGINFNDRKSLVAYQKKDGFPIDWLKAERLSVSQ